MATQYLNNGKHFAIIDLNSLVSLICSTTHFFKFCCLAAMFTGNVLETVKHM